MTRSDIRGLDLTAASDEAVAHLDRAVASYLGLRTDPGDHLKAALAADADLVLGHVLRGYFMLLFANRRLVKRAVDSLAAAKGAAERHGATERERRHIAALEAWCRGDAGGATERWEAILIDHPRDIVALRLAHYWHFYLGTVGELRDSVARTLHGWDEDAAGYGFVEGMYAFGLEEAGDYEAAERWGRSAVERNRADIWAAHAVAHVMEMQGRQREGIDWITGLAGEWSECNNFAYHVWWHRALFWFELGAFDRVLDLYDREVRAETTNDYLDISNAASLLWRLEQEGVDVGGRWVELAERSAERLHDQMMVFADAHYMMTFAAVGDRDNETALLAAERAFANGSAETEAAVAREVGVPLLEALAASRRGEYGRASDLLLPLKPRLDAIGGSRAQRDVFHRTLIEAAIADGRYPLARALLSERLRLRPNSGLTWRRCAEVLLALGETRPAGDAEAEASRLLEA